MENPKEYGVQRKIEKGDWEFFCKCYSKQDADNIANTLNRNNDWRWPGREIKYRVSFRFLDPELGKCWYGLY